MSEDSFAFLFYAGLALVAIIIILAMLGDMVLYWFNGNCFHDWNPWGEPNDQKQYRLCNKCKMIERRDI